MSLFERLKTRRSSNTTSPIQIPSVSLSAIKPTGSANVAPPSSSVAPVWSPKTQSVTRAVGWSRDLERILALPRRVRPSAEQLAALSAKWTKLLGKDRAALKLGPCRCSEYKRRCPTPLLPTQAWTLEEISIYGGLLGPIGVGDGKTLLDLLTPFVMPNCKVAVLLVPAALRVQLVEIDWDFYEQHWHLPYRAGARWRPPNGPVTHVLAYSELSGAANTARLNEINPDTVIGDEAQALRNLTTARGKRFSRFMHERPNTRGVFMSGTLTSKEMADYAHFAEYALGDGSPVPRHYPTLLEWGGALDPVQVGEMPTPPGELMKLCEPGETLQKAWQRRLCETPGVVSSPEDGNCKAALNFYERPIVAPPSVMEAYDRFNRIWERDDGERVVTGLDKSRYLRQLASGLYTRWYWPRNETSQVRARWIAVRKQWHKELGEKLKHSKEFMDSPLLLTKAAIRWHDGYIHIERKSTGHVHTEACYENYETHDEEVICGHAEETEGVRREIPPHTKNGPQPTWDADSWLEWREVRDTAEPKTEAVWIDDFLARDCAKWATQQIGIVWYEHVAFGAKVAALAGIPQFGPGEEASRAILSERGKTSIVASIRSHGTGKNLQPFSRNLVANPPSDGATWEQLIGRTHRTGQIADEVELLIYRHMPAMVEAVDRAKQLAGHIQGTFGGSQKLLKASFGFK